MKILIIRLSAMGDVIHCLPMAAAIKRSIPGAELSWLIDPASAELIKGNPCIDKAIVFPAKDWSASSKDPKNWLGVGSQVGAFLKEYRQNRFDVVIETQGLLKSAVLAVASGAPVRIGFKDTREFADLLLTDAVDVGNYFGHDKPVVELNLALVEYLCKKLNKSTSSAVEFPLPVITPTSMEKIGSFLAQLAPVAPKMTSTPGVTPKQGNQDLDINVNFTVLIPGTTWSSKTWPESSWLELAKMLATKIRSPIALVGGTSEKSTNSNIYRKFQAECPGAPIVDLTGKTTLLDLVALFNLCDLAIGGDTGPLHLAAATEHPKVVGIFGSTPKRRNGPYGRKCHTIALDLDCQPCYSKVCPLGTIACLKDLHPERVYSEIVSFYRKASGYKKE
jgi:lipopolysaccharide heptosyltransferase I